MRGLSGRGGEGWGCGAFPASVCALLWSARSLCLRRHRGNLPAPPYTHTPPHTHPRPPPPAQPGCGWWPTAAPTGCTTSCRGCCRVRRPRTCGGATGRASSRGTWILSAPTCWATIGGRGWKSWTSAMTRWAGVGGWCGRACRSGGRRAHARARTSSPIHPPTRPQPRPPTPPLQYSTDLQKCITYVRTTAAAAGVPPDQLTLVALGERA